VSDPKEQQRPRATPELRFEDREVTRNGQLIPIRRLQQLWLMPDGSTEWRDVPCVRQPRRSENGQSQERGDGNIPH
jgi:hypothetical protein